MAVSDPGAGDLKVFTRSGKYKLRSERGLHLHEPLGVDYHPWSKETIVVDKLFNCVFVHAPSGEVKDIITKYGDLEEQAMTLKQPCYTSFDYAGKFSTRISHNALQPYMSSLWF